MTMSVRLFALIGGVAIALSSAQEVSQKEVESDSVISEGDAFRELGKYRVTGATHLKLGKATDLPKGEMVFQVYTDGIDIRLCPEGESGNYLSFQIYRDGGIYDEEGENLLPGVMAFSDQGEVVRHLCVEPRMLVLTKFPTSTSNIEVTYALRESS
jgi:hypothetical protein